VTSGSRIVATATDADGNTSEFSMPLVYGAAAVVPVSVVGDAASILMLLALMAGAAAWQMRRPPGSPRSR